MSIMNILRTGNILIDTIVSMSIPALFISINFLLRFLIPLINTILLFFTSNTDNIEKLLEYEVKYLLSYLLSYLIYPYLLT